MAIYEFRCNNCKEVFEVERPMTDDSTLYKCPYCNILGICEKLISLSSFSLSWSPPIKDGVRTPVKRIGGQLYDEKSYNTAKAGGHLGKVKRIMKNTKNTR